jgi:FixJ family two-component response regulator
MQKAGERPYPRAVFGNHRISVAAPLVCVVDEDASVRESLDTLIRAGGYRTSLFNSAEALLESNDRHEMRCLVSDVKLPGHSGFELQCLLAEQSVRVPVIFMTTLSDEMRALAMAHGAFAALRKPDGGGVDLVHVIGEALKQTKRR